VVPDPLSGVRPLGDGVGSGYLRDGSPSVWSRGKALVCPRSQLFVKMGAHAAVLYGVADTVSDILMVNPAGVTDVYYVSLYSRLTSRLDLSL